MTKTLGDVTLAIVDCAHKTAPIDPEGDYFAVGTPAMRGNQINFDEARRISHPTFVAWTERLRPRYGDLLFAREAPVGPIVKIPKKENVAPGQRTVLIRPNPELIDSTFLYYLIGSPLQQYRLEALAEGSTVAHLNVADVRSFRLPELPRLDQQRAIAEVLSALDDKIAANTRLAATADELAGAIVRDALDPARSVPLDSLARITMGSSPTGSTLNEDGDGTVFYQGVRDFGTRFPSRRVWTTAPTRTADEGDILVSVRAPVGEVNVANERICVGRGLAAVRSKTNRQHTLFHLLRHVPEAWAPYEAEGTVFGSINRAQLHGILLPEISSDRDEDQLESQIGALEMRIGAALRESEALTKTRDTLLPQLMSGKLRVREAEEVVNAL